MRDQLSSNDKKMKKFWIKYYIQTVILFTGVMLCTSFMNLKADSANKSDGNVVAIPNITLTEDKGRDEVEAYCGTCHSLRLVIQQGLSREQWRELLIWMTEEQEMDKIPDDDEKLVLDYLAKHFSVEQHRKRFKH